MFERGNGEGFALEPGAELVPVEKFTGKHFDGDFALELGIKGAVHRRHAAFAERGAEFVTTDAGRSCHG